MDSASLTNFGLPFDFASAQSHAPKSPGVYVLRIKGAKKFPRLLGETDILYIGSTNNLNRRFFEYNHPRKSKYTTNQKVNDFVNKYKNDAEFIWKTEQNAERARATESDLLRWYQDDHHEFPPLNGASVWTLKLTLPPEKINIKDKLDIRNPP